MYIFRVPRTKFLTLPRLSAIAANPLAVANTPASAASWWESGEACRQQSVKKVAMRRDCEKEHEGDEMGPRAGRRGVIETVAHLGAWRVGR